MSIIRKLIFLLVLLGSTFNLSSQTSIGLGWAQNSVNAPVFRKNSVTSFGGIQYASYYDSVGNVILAKRELGSENWIIKKTQYTGNKDDAHRSISIGVDGNGFLHFTWDHHNNSLNYCMAIDSGSIEMGVKTTMTGLHENDVTYPEFFRMPNGDLVFMYRFGISGRGNMVINKYIVSEKKWIRLHDVLIDGENLRNAYWQSCVSKDGVIHVSYVWRETWDVSSNHDMCYAKSSDGGVTWYNSKNEKYSIPITLSTSEKVSVIPQKRELINQTSMYADSKGVPFIVSYWRPSSTNNVPQYQMIYQQNNEWKTILVSNRKTPFSLSGGGTKKIPISRPQVVIDDSSDSTKVYLIYRDVERESKVSVNVCYNLEADTTQWYVYNLTDYSVDSWEPSYDTDLWKDSLKLDLFVQKMGQGDGETLEKLKAQPVYILRMKIKGDAVDTFSIP